MSTVLAEQTVDETQYTERRTFIDDLDKRGKDKVSNISIDTNSNIPLKGR